MAGPAVAADDDESQKGVLVAVDPQLVCDEIRAVATGLGALRAVQLMDDHSAVAVLPAVTAAAALKIHGLFIALR